MITIIVLSFLFLVFASACLHVVFVIRKARGHWERIKSQQPYAESKGFRIRFRSYNWQWNLEWKNGGIRVHDYFSIMFQNFPILVFRRLDNPSRDDWEHYAFAILIFEWDCTFKALDKKKNIK